MDCYLPFSNTSFCATICDLNTHLANYSYLFNISSSYIISSIQYTRLREAEVRFGIAEFIEFIEFIYLLSINSWARLDGAGVPLYPIFEILSSNVRQQNGIPKKYSVYKRKKIRTVYPINQGTICEDECIIHSYFKTRYKNKLNSFSNC